MQSAWIHELDEEDDRSRLTGRFGVSLRGPAGDRRGPGTFALGDAVRFGREQATRVYVDVNGTRYTAGADPDDEYRAWPEYEVARPRPLGTPLDGSVQRIPWLIQGRIRAEGDAGALATHVEDCLRAADDAQRPTTHSGRRWPSGRTACCTSSSTSRIAAPGRRPPGRPRCSTASWARRRTAASSWWRGPAPPRSCGASAAGAGPGGRERACALRHERRSSGSRFGLRA